MLYSRWDIEVGDIFIYFPYLRSDLGMTEEKLIFGNLYLEAMKIKTTGKHYIGCLKAAPVQIGLYQLHHVFPFISMQVRVGVSKVKEIA